MLSNSNHHSPSPNDHAPDHDRHDVAPNAPHRGSTSSPDTHYRRRCAMSPTATATATPILSATRHEWAALATAALIASLIGYVILREPPRCRPRHHPQHHRLPVVHRRQRPPTPIRDTGRHHRPTRNSDVRRCPRPRPHLDTPPSRSGRRRRHHPTPAPRPRRRNAVRDPHQHRQPAQSPTHNPHRNHRALMLERQIRQ